MKATKYGRFLTTVPVLVWWLSDKIEERRRKKRARTGVDSIDNLERLHRLKEKGVLTQDEFSELKEALKKQICVER